MQRKENVLAKPDVAQVSTSPQAGVVRRSIVTIIAVAVVIFLALFNLTGYPTPWFDEGLNFQPSKNLVLHGQYAMLSSEGFRVLDPAIQTGPPVILPIALSFKMLGIGLFQARLVTSLFSVLGVVVYYRIAQSLYNQAVSWLAVILLLTFAVHDSFVSYLYLGRQVLGEVPALFFFLSGLLVWFRSWERVESRYLIGAGLLFGLAMVTKSQFNLLVPPTLLAVWLTGFFAFKMLHLRHLVIPAILCAGLVLIWYGCQVMIAGPQQFSLNVAILRAGMYLHVLNFSLATMRHSLGVLARTGYVVWGSLSLVHALWHSRQRNLATLRRLALLVFAGLWLAWYAVASICWPRYTFVAVAVSHIFYAALLYDALATLASLKQASPKRRWLQTISAFALLAIAGWMLISGYSTIRSILRNHDDSYFQFARYLNESIPPDAIVESWEWELDLVTDLRYHHPPTWVTNAVTRRLWEDDSESGTVYDPREFAPEYLVVGPVARWTRVYTDTGLLDGADLQGSIGQYELYRVNSSVHSQ
jgi:4-amino-4-deoxy-L-arabinose transferase-like glycosyltransferase